MSRSVKLHVYDLSGGLARAMSMSLLGKQIDGIWHTGVVVDGTEYFYGGGIQRCPAAQSPFGQPLQVIHLGDTEVPDDMLNEFLEDLAPRYNAFTYDLMSNNCNNFSEELSQLLLGVSIPAHITGLPAEVLATPFGQMIVPMLQPALQQRLGTATASGFASGLARDPAPAAAPVAAAAVRSAAAGGAELANAARECTQTAETSGVASTAGADASAVVDAAARLDEAGRGLAAQAAEVQAAAGSGGPSAQAKARFEEAVRTEFLKLVAEGLLDHNAAGIEALKRAMVTVRQ